MRLCAQILVLSAALAGASELLAARHIGFETDAFNRVFPMSYRKSVVFSPASFELDCAVVAESLETIPKAGVSETLGVTIDFEGTYRPILEAYTACTNGLSITMARGFCVPELRKAQPAHCQYLQRVYQTEVMRAFPAKGAESWFRAAMDGLMEDFEIPVHIARSDRYSFYDLVAIKAAWKTPFPVEKTAPRAFHLADNEPPRMIEFLSDVRSAITWETQDYTLLRLPMADESWFYAILPKEGVELAVVRAALSSTRIDRLLSACQSMTEPNLREGLCEIALPKIELSSRLNILGALQYFRIPTRGLTALVGSGREYEYVQSARFELSERGGVEASQPVPPETPDVKTLVFDRPFVFFIYHEPSETIPIAGQFTGI